MTSFDPNFDLNFPSQYSIDLQADKDGMLGRTCIDNECKKYFKVNTTSLSNHQGSLLCCPYCGASGNTQAFNTQEQINYAVSVVQRQVIGKFGNELKKLEMHTDPGAFISFGISVDLGELPSLKHYLERDIKKVTSCSKCNGSFALYGISYFCPFCGPRDHLDVFLENVELTKKKMHIDDLLGSGKEILHNEGLQTDLVENALKDCITIFEGYCKNMYVAHQLARKPNVDEKQLRKSIGTSFQNIKKSNSLFNQDFGFEIVNAIEEKDLKKVINCFSKRHALIHNLGIIDLKYIEQTGDYAKMLGRRVIVNAQEVKTLLELIVKLIMSLDNRLRSKS